MSCTERPEGELVQKKHLYTSLVIVLREMTNRIELHFYCPQNIISNYSHNQKLQWHLLNPTSMQQAGSPLLVVISGWIFFPRVAVALIFQDSEQKHWKYLQACCCACVLNTAEFI